MASAQEPKVQATSAPASSIAPPLPLLSEELICRLWEGQRFPESALQTAAWTPLRVLLPGRPGRGPGPDFRNAIIAPPSGSLLRGDVEVHLRASDFRAHGHARDRRYNDLVLHLVFDACGELDTPLQNGRRVPIVALSDWLQRRAGELQGWLARPTLWREPCHDAVARVGHHRVLALLDGLGQARFEGRIATLQSAVRSLGEDAALYNALLEALFYGGHTALVATVTTALPYHRLVRLLSGIPDTGERERKAGRLLLEAATCTAFAPPTGRPANRPERRIVGMARLLARHWPLTEAALRSVDATPQRLISSWSAPPHIGRSRAIELVTNAVLPWAVACARLLDASATARSAVQAFAALPRPGRYGALAFLESNLAGARPNPPLTARRQQGLLALYKSECTRGGCGRCALS